MNVGELMKERDLLLQEIEDYVDPRPGMRAKVTNWNRLIALYDPIGNRPPDELRTRRSGRPRAGTTHECLVPLCSELTPGERCSRHAARWQKSQLFKDKTGAVECKVCPPEMGGWVKNVQGLRMHVKTIHPGITVEDALKGKTKAAA